MKNLDYTSYLKIYKQKVQIMRYIYITPRIKSLHPVYNVFPKINGLNNWHCVV